jgi:hypothetical protein
MMWRAAHLLYILPDTFWACFIAAAPLSSNMAGTAAFSPLVLSQRHVNRHGISGSRHVTIVKEEGERPVTQNPIMALPVPQARGLLVEGSMKSEIPRAGCRWGGYRLNRQPLSLVERTVHCIAVNSQANGWINRPRKSQIRA